MAPVPWRTTSTNSTSPREFSRNTVRNTAMPLSSCQILHLPRVTDPRGNLTFVEGGRHVPFDIQRVYYLYDVPGGAERGGHAHRDLHQVVIALSGSFDVVLD